MSEIAKDENKLLADSATCITENSEKFEQAQGMSEGSISMN